VKPDQCLQTTAVSCYRVRCPAPGSAAPASRCARTVTAIAPAMAAEHPANTATATLKYWDSTLYKNTWGSGLRQTEDCKDWNHSVMWLNNYSWGLDW
jgi:hypothetical protein